MKNRAEASGIPLVKVDIVPGRLAVYAAEDPDALLEDLSEETFRASDERMPYFGTLWPAGAALARAVLEGARLDGRTVLDLGCGVGAPGLAAAVQGATVTFLDWEPRSLEIVAQAAEAQGLEPAALHRADWRAPLRLPPFDRVLAADVLYEARNVKPIAAFLARHLAPGGEAWIADPGRVHADGLAAASREHGLEVPAPRALPASADGIVVTLHRVALPA